MEFFDTQIIILILLLISFLIVIGAALFWALQHSGSGERHFSAFGGRGLLNQYSRNLTELGQKGLLEPVIGREKEIRKVIQILSRKSKNNPVLVGKAGVGKTAIAEGLAQAIVDGLVPPILQDKQVLALDLTSIIAGTKFRGEFEKRLLAIRDEIIAAQRNIILFIDEIHTLAEAGQAEGALDADDILKPALARGELQVVGATTNDEYEQYISKDMTLARRLQLIYVDEPTPKETLNILRGIKHQYEMFHGVKIHDASLKAAVELSKKYLKKRAFPDKAIDVIDEACSKVKLDSLMKKKPALGAMPEVLPKDVEEIMQEMYHNGQQP